MGQTARSRRRAERAIAEGRIPGRPGPAKKRNEADQKAVLKERFAAWYAANREQILQEKREEYHANLEKARAAAAGRIAKARAADPDKYREISRAASKQRKAAKAIAEGRVPGRVGNPKRFSSEERPAAIEAKRKRWADKKGTQTLRQMWVAAQHRRRSRKVSVGGNYTLADVVYLFDLQKGKCPFCLKPLEKGRFHIDHHTPLALGGSNDRSNLRLLHNKCNLSKGARDPAEHALRNGLLCW